MKHYCENIPQVLETALAELHKETSAAFDTATHTGNCFGRDAVDHLLEAQRAVISAMDFYDAAKRLLKQAT